MFQIYDGHYVIARYGYRVRGNRRAAFLGCGEKTAKSEGIVKPAAIQMRSPVGEPQCGNIEWERSRGGGDDGEKEIGGAVIARGRGQWLSFGIVLEKRIEYGRIRHFNN